MKVFLLYAHPVETSFNASVHEAALLGLAKAGHEVDDCDLYKEGFQPLLTREERIYYHDETKNRDPVDEYVVRLQRAEAMVIISPVWNFGFPAILKGFFDRVFLPGVSFNIADGKVRPALQNITKITACLTYGTSRLYATLAGDPPHKVINRALRFTIKPGASVKFLSLYDLNRATSPRLGNHLERVEKQLATF